MRTLAAVTRHTVPVLALAAALLVAGCGGAEPETAPSSTPPASSTSAAATTPTETAFAGTEIEVAVKDGKVDPPTHRVKVAKLLVGQVTVIRLSDPLGTDADWLGTADRGIDPTLADPTLVAVIQVTAVVSVTCSGVILAHDRAVRLLPRGRAVVGQIPLLVLMVAYTVGGLSLLFGS